MTNYQHIAEQMYAAYCQQAGGLTFDGKPLPSFQELGLERQTCWKAAAEAAHKQYAQPQADALDAESWVSESDSKPLEADGEVFVRFSDGTFGTGWAAYWHGASNDFAQWCHPDPDEDRTVTHWMKPPAIDAAIAAAKENK